MPKSAATIGLDEILAPIALFLKGQRFRKSGRTFNRQTPEGLVQVINFQMGQFPIGNYVIPGIRENLYGKFTMNLGIVLPCIWRIERHWEPKKFYQEYECEIRMRLGHIPDDDTSDSWWTISPPYEVISSEIGELLQLHGLSFLDGFSSYGNVLCEFERVGILPSVPEGRSALIAAVVYHDQGDRPASVRAFQRAKETENQAFMRHVSAIEKECMG